MPWNITVATASSKSSRALRGRFQPVGLLAGFLFVELTARREGMLYPPGRNTLRDGVEQEARAGFLGLSALFVTDLSRLWQSIINDKK
jgi:hypothetical protein